MAILMQFFLPVVPDSAPIVINVNQYDYDDPEYAGRLVFNLIYNGTEYDMTGATASIQGTKPDGKVFAYDATVNGSVVQAKLTEQMTAVYGRTVGNLIVEDADGNRIGTFAFWLEVQKSALDGAADPSETQIPTLIALASAQAQAAQESATEAASSADEAAAYTGHPAYIGLNGNWYVFNTTTGLYEDSGVNATGRIGSQWYNGTAITGTSTTPAAFPTGIEMAYEDDMYLNIATGNVYTCTLEGDEDTALWKYLMTLSGGGGLADWSIITNKPFETIGNGLHVNGDDVLELDSAIVRYAGKKTFAQLDDTLLIAANENNFFMLSDSGYITSSNINLWSDNYVVGDHIMTDSHIAVIAYTGSDPNKGPYVFDDFGGFVEVDEFTAAVTQSGTTVTFDNLNPAYGYKLFWDSASATGDLSVPRPVNINQTSGTNTGTIKLTYTIKGGTSGSSQFKLRILK